MENLKKKLLALSEAQFKPDAVLKHLEDAASSLEVDRYTHFDESCYTRNLICKNKIFEMILLCWEPGQATMIHDHASQGCWMVMMDGLIMSDNYKYVSTKNFKGSLEKTSCTSFKKGQSYYIDDTISLHLLRNPAKADQRAMTLHVYSKPFSTCKVYDLEKKSVDDLVLQYHSLQGKRGGPWLASEIKEAP